MKKVVLLVILVVASISIYAQKGEKTLGLNVAYGSETETIGVGARFTYNITDALRIAPSLNYYPKSDGISMFETNADVHYLFPIVDKLVVYPLGGLSFTSWDSDNWKDTENRFGINAGGGVEYRITNNFAVGSELKYSIISDFDQLVFSCHAVFRF